MNTREELILGLQASYRTIANQEQWHQKYQSKIAAVQQQKRLIDNCQASKFGKGVLLWLALGSVGFLLMLFEVVMPAIFGLKGPVAIVISIVLGVIVIVAAIAIYKLGVKLVLEPMAQRKAAPLKAQLARLEQERATSEKDFRASLQVREAGSFAHQLDKKYYSTAAVGFLLQAVQGMRADTLKEALNLYEEHLHRQKLENNQQQILARQQQLQQDMERVEQLAADAASAADHAAWVAYSNR